MKRIGTFLLTLIFCVTLFGCTEESSTKATKRQDDDDEKEKITVYKSGAVDERLGNRNPKTYGDNLMQFEICTDSMSPTFIKGSIIVCKEVEDATTLAVGDIITYWTVINGERLLVTHRIAEIYDGGVFLVFATKGDGNAVIDPLTVHESEIVGKFVEKKGGFLDDLFGSTAPEVREVLYQIYTDTNSSLQVDIRFDEIVLFSNLWDFANIEQYGEEYIALIPAALNLTADGKINPHALLQIPLYGADGRVSDMVDSVCGTLFDDGFRESDDLGFRAVGVSDDQGKITELYGFVMDFTLVTQEANSSVLLDSEGSKLILNGIDATYQDEKVRELLQSYRVVLFDTDTNMVLSAAAPVSDEMVRTETTVEVPLSVMDTMENEAHIQLTAGNPANISALVYLDGMSLTNGMVHLGMITCGVRLGFTE